MTDIIISILLAYFPRVSLIKTPTSSITFQYYAIYDKALVYVLILSTEKRVAWCSI